MEVKSKAKNIRISPTKARLVIEVIKEKNALQALNELEFINKKASKLISKILKSAIANAKNNYSLDDKNLYVSKIFADCGPIYKRVRFRARGRQDIISKRTAHITIVLSERKEKIKKETKLTQQLIQEEIKKEQAQEKEKEKDVKKKKEVKKKEIKKEEVSTEKEQKIRKDVEKEKSEAIIEEKKKFPQKDKKPKFKKKESFFKKIFRRKSV